MKSSKSGGYNRLWKTCIFMSCMIIIAGAVWQAAMGNYEMKRIEPVGEAYNIESHYMHLHHIGEGENTLVFIAGSGTVSSYTDFYYLQNELRNYAETVSFDHAGYGWSQKTKSPRTVDNLAKELNELLEMSGQSDPYILVAHSLGSLEALRFAQKYPEQVQGIVLLDGGSPEFYSSDLEIKAYLANRLSAALRVTGISRALGSLGIKLPLGGENLRNCALPDEVRRIDALMYYNQSGSESNLDVIERINENAKIVLENGHISDIPMLILSSNSGEDWQKSQSELLEWSNNSSKKTIADSAHYIHWSNKELVLSEIIRFLSDSKSDGKIE